MLRDVGLNSFISQLAVVTHTFRRVRPNLQNIAGFSAAHTISSELVEEKRHATTQFIALHGVVRL
jgi:hypothetical protein